jgi:hypothetical protein
MSSGYWKYHQFNDRTLHVLPTQCIFMCFVWISGRHMAAETFVWNWKIRDPSAPVTWHKQARIGLTLTGHAQRKHTLIDFTETWRHKSEVNAQSQQQFPATVIHILIDSLTLGSYVKKKQLTLPTTHRLKQPICDFANMTNRRCAEGQHSCS